MRAVHGGGRGRLQLPSLPGCGRHDHLHIHIVHVDVHLHNVDVDKHDQYKHECFSFYGYED